MAPEQVTGTTTISLAALCRKMQRLQTNSCAKASCC
jgi:hypothetical protein